MALGCKSSVLLVVLLTVSVASVQGHGSSRLRLLIGSAGPGSTETSPVPLSGDPNQSLMGCPAGQTLNLATLDAAQNPTCVSCGSSHQFCCQGSKCSAGLQCFSKGVVQPVCIPAEKFKLRTTRRTAKGKRRGAAVSNGSGTISITKDVGCGIAGWACCSDNPRCGLGNVCNAPDGTVGTCVPDTKNTVI